MILSKWLTHARFWGLPGKVGNVISAGQLAVSPAENEIGVAQPVFFVVDVLKQPHEVTALLQLSGLSLGMS